jgi:hypothetical protein
MLPSRSTASGARLKPALIDTCGPELHRTAHGPPDVNRLVVQHPLLRTGGPTLPHKAGTGFLPPRPLVVDPSRRTAVMFHRLFSSKLHSCKKRRVYVLGHLRGHLTCT